MHVIYKLLVYFTQRRYASTTKKNCFRRLGIFRCISVAYWAPTLSEFFFFCSFASVVLNLFNLVISSFLDKFLDDIYTVFRKLLSAIPYFLVESTAERKRGTTPHGESNCSHADCLRVYHDRQSAVEGCHTWHCLSRELLRRGLSV